MDINEILGIEIDEKAIADGVEAAALELKDSIVAAAIVLAKALVAIVKSYIANMAK